VLPVLFFAMIKKLEVIPIADPRFDEWTKKITGEFQGNKGPFETTLEELRADPWNAVTVIIESHYVDSDYQDEFSAFYCKAFKMYPSRCTRVHFFDCPLPSEIPKDVTPFQDNYIGFVVIRPTDLQRMGRTLLRPPIKDENREFIHCKTNFSAHLLGDRLTINAMPFVQQDTQVGACAQAALWTVARYMAQRFGHREYLPSEINHLAKAKSANGRALPAEFGLTISQMLDALEGMGFFAWGQSHKGMFECAKHIESAFDVNLTTMDIGHQVERDAERMEGREGDRAAEENRQKERKQEEERQRNLQLTAKLADVAYRYIESGLPVILATPDHALVAIGHTYDPSAVGTVSIKRIPEWIVHNDSVGPYIKMPLFSLPPKILPFSKVTEIIAIAPREVTLRGEEAEPMARQSIETLLEEEKEASGTTWRDLFEDTNPTLKDCLDQLEYRTFLIPSVEFQSHLKLDIKEGRFPHRDLGEEILALDFPRYVWVTEISSSQLLNHPKREHRYCLGRVIVDSTAPVNTRGQMMLHFCDLVHFMDRQGESAPIRELYPNSTPFGHKIIP
jgi:hypothetical protein